jgi:SAM-dependent methyltransferase
MSSPFQTEQEPLALSAPLAWHLAPQLCRRDSITGEDCTWSHRLWQILRLLDLNTTPVHQGEFMRSALAVAMQGLACPRVLVSGAADYGMLAQVLMVLGERAAEIVVVDRCETPLMLNRWYAERAGRSILTVCSDILAFSDARLFDVVCTHSFLGQVPADRRAGLVALWHRCLHPGGTVVTVNRVRPLAADVGSARFSVEQSEALLARMRAGAASLPAEIDIDLSELLRVTQGYTRHHLSYPTRSLEEIRELFERAGFRVDELRCAQVAGAQSDKIGGPTTPGCAEYAQLVAVRI